MELHSQWYFPSVCADEDGDYNYDVELEENDIDKVSSSDCNAAEERDINNITGFDANYSDGNNNSAKGLDKINETHNVCSDLERVGTNSFNNTINSNSIKNNINSLDSKHKAICNTIAELYFCYDDDDDDDNTHNVTAMHDKIMVSSGNDNYDQVKSTSSGQTAWDDDDDINKYIRMMVCVIYIHLFILLLFYLFYNVLCYFANYRKQN